MIYAIGLPGNPVRMFIETVEPWRAVAQARPGEVVLPCASAARWQQISADGEAVVAGVPDAAVLLEEVRHQRNQLLAASQWTQGEDSPLTAPQRAAWAAYRQALRDVPQDQPAATPETVIWPAAPA